MSLVDELVVMCDEIEDMVENLNYVTPETTLINCNYKASCWVIAVVLLAIVCLLLVLVMVIKHYMKQEITIPCLLSLPLCRQLSYWYKDEWCKKIDIKSFTYYFLDDMINVKKFNPKKIKIDKVI